MNETKKMITLEDDSKFIVTEMTNLNNENYFRALEVVNNNITENEVIFKEVNDNGEVIIEKVQPSELYDQLENIFNDILFSNLSEITKKAQEKLAIDINEISKEVTTLEQLMDQMVEEN